MKVVIATEKPFDKAAVAEMKVLMEAAGLEVALLEKYTERAEFIKALGDPEAAIIRSDKILEDCIAEGVSPNLKIVVRAGAGTDNVCLAAKEKLVVENTPGQNSNAVAELAFGMMVMMARQQYNGKSGFELSGKKLGLHAFGAVGRCMAKIAKGFSMEVVAFDPFIPKEAISAAGVTPANTLEDMYKECDFVSLHIPATPQTTRSINEALMMSMKPTAVLVNTARAEVVNEEDLVKVMATRPSFMYCADVAPTNAALLKEKHAQQFFSTPKKMGAQTAEANFNAGVAAAKQVIAYLTKGEIQFQVKK